MKKTDAERLNDYVVAFEVGCLVSRGAINDGTFDGQRLSASKHALSTPNEDVVSECLRWWDDAIKSGLLVERNLSNYIEQENESIQDVADDVLERAKKYGFKPDEDMVREAVEESANLLNIELTEPQITEACQRVMNPRDVSNYIEHPTSGQPQEHFLNTDPSVIEAKVMKDYAHFLGKDVLVSRISGFVGDDSTDIELSPPAKVRVEATSEQSLKRWIDGWCDPVYEVVLVEDHPQLACVRPLWIHGPSLHLNGKQTEVSDIVSIAEPIAPRHDDTPSP